ncbi:MAG: hypothetical protein LBR22_00735 [Desulfovibrio sp.]|jgi:hypothetical protein|nr:hypothetical protein [Desulfovibrio sp.]
MAKTAAKKPGKGGPEEQRDAFEDDAFKEDVLDMPEFQPVTPDSFQIDARDNVVEQLLGGSGNIGFSCGFADAYNTFFRDIRGSQKKRMTKAQAAAVERLKAYLKERYEGNVRKSLAESRIVMGVSPVPDESNVTFH